MSRGVAGSMNSIFAQFNLARDREPAESVHQSVENAAVLRGTNLWILVFAIFIASLGLNVNSTAVIIGAMLISPLMGPIIAFGYGLATNDASLLQKSAKNFAFAFVTSLVTSTIFFLLSPIRDVTGEMLARTSPNIYDVLIALFGGAAGFLAISSKNKGNVIPGVAIATALMPPLCTAGYGLANLNLTFFGGALYLFIINSVMIALATVLMAKILRLPVLHRSEGANALPLPAIGIIVALTVLPSIYFGYDVVKQNRFRKRANDFVNNEAKFKNDYLLQRNIDPGKREISLTYGGDPISAEAIESVRAKLPDYGLGDAKLKIGQGFAYEQDTSALDRAGADRERLASLLSAQEERLKSLEAKAEQADPEKELASQMLEEIKIIYPTISTMELGDPLPGDANMRSVTVTSQGELDQAARTKIETWLKARLRTNTVDARFLSLK